MNGSVQGGEYGAVSCGSDSEVFINGNCISTDEYTSCGACANGGGEITINGIIDTVAGYVVAGSDFKGISDITLPTTKDGYRTYTDGTSNVWVKMQLVCEIEGGSQYEAFDDALGDAADGDTIRLLDDINSTFGIVIDGKDITFDLNGHALDIESTSADGLRVSDAVVDIAIGSTGTFDVTGYTNGVYVEGAGASATVTGAHSTGTNGRGAYANEGAAIHVRGDITATGENSIGACVANGSNITAAGDVQGINCGTVCFGAGSWIRVYGDCISTNPSGIGARAGEGGEITIDGVIESSSTYIMIGSTAMDFEDFTPQTNYCKYSDDTSTVLVKMLPVCEIDGGASYPILDLALNDAVDGDTIRLLADIGSDTPIQITGKAIVLDLNGHNLNVEVSYGDALNVLNGGISSLMGPGSFNVTGVECGVEAMNSGIACVTNVRSTGTEGGAGVAAYGASTVTILGDVNGAYSGIDARDGSTVFAEGNVTGEIEIGVSANGSTVFVDGDVTGSQEGVAAYGDDSSITVRGNVTSGGTGALAYDADTPGIVIQIDGVLTAAGNYVVTGDQIKDGSTESRIIPSVMSGYHTYSDGTHFVCIRILDYTTVGADPAVLPSSGGSSEIVITGSSLPSGITVTAFDDSIETDITGMTEGSDTEQSVTLSFPSNTSTTENKAYTIRIMLTETQGWSLETTTVTVGKAAPQDNTDDSEDDNNNVPADPPPSDNETPPGPPADDDVPDTEEVIDPEPDEIPEDEAPEELPEESAPESDTDVASPEENILDDVPKTGEDTESFPIWLLLVFCMIIPAGFTIIALTRRNRKCS